MQLVMKNFIDYLNMIFKSVIFWKRTFLIVKIFNFVNLEITLHLYSKAYGRSLEYQMKNFKIHWVWNLFKTPFFIS